MEQVHVGRCQRQQMRCVVIFPQPHGHRFLPPLAQVKQGAAAWKGERTLLKEIWN